MKKSTNNYERPEVQVVYVETEAGFAVVRDMVHLVQLVHKEIFLKARTIKTY